jgi:hypothetical protein
MTTQPKLDRKLTSEREREIRELLGLADTAFEDELATVLHCSTRTIQRFDLPYTVIGSKRIYDLPGSGERLRHIARIGTPGSDDAAEGALPPAVRHRLRMQREPGGTDPPA